MFVHIQIVIENCSSERWSHDMFKIQDHEKSVTASVKFEWRQEQIQISCRWVKPCAELICL